MKNIYFFQRLKIMIFYFYHNSPKSGPGYCTILFYIFFFSMYVKEIKITIGDDVCTCKFMVLPSKLGLG